MSVMGCSRMSDLIHSSGGRNLLEELNGHGHDRQRRGIKLGPPYCVFCKNNEEPSSFYRQHILKDIEGRVVCPVLFRYVCPICKATGEDAHTVRHCPYNKDNLEKLRALSAEWAKLANGSDKSASDSSTPPPNSDRNCDHDNDPLESIMDYITNPKHFWNNIYQLLEMRRTE